MSIPPLTTIKDAFQKAPDYVKQFIKSKELDKVFSELRAEHKLHLDEAGVLADSLNSVALGLIPLEAFEKTISENLPRLNPASRTKLVADVNQKVFAVLRERATAPPLPPATETKLIEPEALRAEPEPVPSAAIQIARMPKAPLQSVVNEKLSAPTSESPKDVTMPMPPAANPRYSGGSDPYREPIE